MFAPLGATFLRQRTAHLRVDPLGPRGASSGDVPPPPSSTGVDAAETSGAGAGAGAATANMKENLVLYPIQNSQRKQHSWIYFIHD